MSLLNIRREKVFLNFIKGMVVDLPCSMKLNYFWNFGSILGVVLGAQMVSGLLLSLIYKSDMKMAFKTVDLLNRDVWGGWVCRFIHLAGAKAFFLFLYLHIGRGMYYMVYKQKLHVWLSGCLMFVMAMATAFLGYVLPWGQMSYWGATVMTNFFSMMPLYGIDLVVWMWGGYAVDYPTLTRFFGLHFLFPFIMLALVIVHVILLHEKGSLKSLGVTKKKDKIEFFPYYLIKDVYGFSMMLFFSYYIFFLYPDLFMESENYMEANSLMTPVHIQPEWYFLSAYAMLRSMPSKLGGVLALLSFILMMFIYPFMLKSNKVIINNISHQLLFWLFCSNFIVLTWLGACPVEDPYMIMSRVSSLLYFLYFFLKVFLWKGVKMHN